MTYKIPATVPAALAIVDKGPWTAGSTSAVNNVWTYTPAGGVAQRWIDTLGGATVLAASPTAANGAQAGRFVEQGEVNTANLFSTGWTQVAAKTSAYTANAGEKVPTDSTSAAFAVTLPAATVSGTSNPTRVQVTNTAAPTVTNVVTVTPAGTDSIDLPASALPLTVAPGETVTMECLAATKWSLV